MDIGHIFIKKKFEGYEAQARPVEDDCLSLGAVAADKWGCEWTTRREHGGGIRSVTDGTPKELLERWRKRKRQIETWDAIKTLHFTGFQLLLVTNYTI